MGRVIFIRDVPEDLYELMWNLRKKYRARSWVDLLRKLTEEYREEVEEEWV